MAVVALDVVFERCRQPIDDPGWAGALGVEQADAVLLLLQEAQGARSPIVNWIRPSLWLCCQRISGRAELDSWAFFELEKAPT